MHRILSIAALLSFVTVAPAVAAKRAWPEDLRLGVSGSVLAVRDGNGGSIVVWLTDGGFRAQRIDRDGRELWPSGGIVVEQSDAPDLPSAHRSHWESDIALVPDGKGGAILGFVRAPQVESTIFHDRLFVQRIGGDGSVRWSPFGVPISLEDSNMSNVRVAVSGEDVFVAWEEDRDGLHASAFVQKLDLEGRVAWPYGGVRADPGDGYPYGPRHGYAYGSAAAPAVVADHTGGVYVAWIDPRDESPFPALYVQHFASDGAVLWPFPGIRVSGAVPYGPSGYAIAGDPEGGLYVAWCELGSPNWGNVYAQRFTAAGTARWSGPGVPVIEAPELQCLAEMVSDGAGGLIVVWQDGSSGGHVSYHGQRLDPEGRRLWPDPGALLLPSEGIFDFSSRARVVADGAGGAAIVAGLTRVVGSALGDPAVVAQRVDAQGRSLWGASGVLVHAGIGTQRKLLPVIAPGASGDAFVAWADSRSGSSQAFAQRIEDDSSTAELPSLSIALDGRGRGRVVSEDGALDCNSACSAPAGVSALTLHAVAEPGWEFVGWSGACSGLGPCDVVLESVHLVTASFEPKPRLRVVAWPLGTGRIFSESGAIDCWDDCELVLAAGATERLHHDAAPGFQFVRWAGDCTGSGACEATLLRDRTVVAVQQRARKLRVTKLYFPGDGKVVSDDGRVDCGQTCEVDYDVPRLVTLLAVDTPGVRFRGWSLPCDPTGASRTCALDLTEDRVMTARFEKAPSGIGVYRPGSRQWFLDHNENGLWDGCLIDVCVPSFGIAGDVPVTGKWGKVDATTIGVFRPSTGRWYLDLDGNGRWDGCAIDRCTEPFGLAGDVPVPGDWRGTGQPVLAVYRPSAHRFYADYNGNGRWDGCGTDLCSEAFGMRGDVPVVGDWSGDGTTRIGVFRPSIGYWFLDANGNRAWDGCSIDRCVSFGLKGDLPVVGATWTASAFPIPAPAAIGVYRPSTGTWYLDANANGRWDSCSVDRCLGAFGFAGDRPLAGAW